MDNSRVNDRPVSAWQPLRNEVFRSLWLATVISNIGTWLHFVGAAWMMTLMSDSPLLVALVQAATSLPMFLFALPAGALSDMLDRRKYLIWVNAGMLLVAGALAILTFGGFMTPWGLLVLTFCLGVGAAMLAPAWQATVPELVQPGELGSAVALNGMGINIARAIGPAIGGILIAAAGPAA
ncbi:MAG: MFS transporter, partial [Rhodothermales bacterium]